VLTRQQKKDAVSELSDKFARAKSVFVSDYRGLSVDDTDVLRTELRKLGEGETEYSVAKNSLLKIASNGSEVETLTEHFTGPTSVTIAYGDPAGVAKVLVKYAEDNDAFEIKGAVLDGKSLDDAEIATLATLPSLLELRGKIAGLLLAPAGKLARLLNEPGGQLARLVAARKDALEE